MIPDPARLHDRLVGEGMSEGAASDAVRRLLRAANAGGAECGTTNAVPGAGFFVPGRVELLGKHTDYAGGRSLLVAMEAGISAVVFADDVPRIAFVDADTGARFRDPLAEGSRGGADPVDRDLVGRPGARSLRAAPNDDVPDAPLPDWVLYPTAYLRRLRADLPTLGCDLRGGAVVAWSSSLPRAAGMSSSTALLVAFHLALASRYGWAERERYRRLLPDRTHLADYLAAVESGRPFGPLEGGGALSGIGLEGGSQDHQAILCARPAKAVQVAFRPTRFEGEAPLPEGWVFALAASGVPARKATEAKEPYNRLAAQAEAILDLWRGEGGSDATPHLGAVLAMGPGALVRLGRILAGSRHLRFPPEVLLARAEQFMDEVGLHVPGARSALAEGDLEGFGRHVRASHRAARTALGNETPETETLTRRAWALGATAASPFGAGFGGGVWALVREAESGTFLERWRRTMLEEYPAREGAARFFRTRAGPPALRVF